MKSNIGGSVRSRGFEHGFESFSFAPMSDPSFLSFRPFKHLKMEVLLVVYSLPSLGVVRCGSTFWLIGEPSKRSRPASNLTPAEVGMLPVISEISDLSLERTKGSSGVIFGPA